MAHILIVDDQQSVLLTLEALLKSDNHLVTACTNAMDAMARLAQEAFDLVISDVVMSGATGYALLRTIRSQPQLARIPVILLTGKREKADVEKGIESGADDYVIKPIDPTLLLAKIRNILAKTDQAAPHFAEASVRVKAEFESKTEVVGISELGCVLQSNMFAPPGILLKVNSEIFKEVGLEGHPTVRIISCDKLETQEGFYKISGNFVGLSEKELTPLRLWIRGKKRF